MTSELLHESEVGPTSVSGPYLVPSLPRPPPFEESFVEASSFLFEVTPRRISISLTLLKADPCSTSLLLQNSPLPSRIWFQSRPAHQTRLHFEVLSKSCLELVSLTGRMSIRSIRLIRSGTVAHQDVPRIVAECARTTRYIRELKSGTYDFSWSELGVLFLELGQNPTPRINSKSNSSNKVLRPSIY